jgi:hypothetical protein
MMIVAQAELRKSSDESHGVRPVCHHLFVVTTFLSMGYVLSVTFCRRRVSAQGCSTFCNAPQK